MKKILYGLLICQMILSAKAGSDNLQEWSHPFISSKEIPVGSADRSGPLCAPYSTHVMPVGWAYVFKSQRPDIFISGKDWYPGTEQGLYLYKFIGQDGNKIPRFEFYKNVNVKPFEGRDVPSQGEIYQDPKNGAIYGVWYVKNKIILCLFNENACEFEEIKSVETKNIKAGVDGLTVIPYQDGTSEIVLGVSNGQSFKPKPQEGAENDWRSDQWRPYTGGGKWRGGWPFIGFYSAATSLLQDPQGPAVFQPASPTENEILMGCNKISRVKLGQAEDDLICGSRFGGIYYLKHADHQSGKLNEKLSIVDGEGIAIRHPAIAPCPMGYPNENGLSDIIAGGECALYYYRFTGKFSSGGNPVYEKPTWVTEKAAKLYLGSLVSFDTGDFDGDGLEDIIAGSSEGYVYFSKNTGSKNKPRFDMPAALSADGKKIHIQQNYMSIQGPGEIRWGYTGTAIADWNEDGLPDILLSSATSEHLVYLNNGTQTAPKLAAGQKLYCNDLNLYGTWRVKPGVAKLGGRMAYIATDEDDELHLYWKLDNFNLRDGGKLKMADGKSIECNGMFGGGRGRIKIELADWDGDGILDMFVGTSRGGSLPNSQKGLPSSRKLTNKLRKGIQVVYLRNTGSNEKPVFDQVKQVQFRGKDLYFGAHESSPAVVDFENPNGPDLLVGVEYGNIIYFAHEDVTFVSLNSDMG